MKSIVSLQDNIRINYKPDLLNNIECELYFDILEKELVYNTKEESAVIIHGEKKYIPRKQVAYGEKGTFYKFSGNKVFAHDWNENNDICNIIIKIKEKVEMFTGEKFNFVLINRYQNGNQYIGFHSDDERDLVPKSSIVGVSIGAKREIQFNKKHYLCHDVKPKQSLYLDNGSIFIVHYPTNQYWKHSIPKSSFVTSPRISFTFRNMINEI